MVLQVIVAAEALVKAGISQEVVTSTGAPVDGVLTRKTLSVVSLEATAKLLPVPAMVNSYPIEGHLSAG